jgi:hypothetical protein
MHQDKSMESFSRHIPATKGHEVGG